ncbi:MAG: cytidine deaminase [Bifidobacteriaceae bacterium]|jgi:cytidine deaminase|nr:cytidine deaminase [Bifidobacteriaceae bacterium]
MENIDLLKKALQVRENSYSPYSKYAVGAAVLCDENMVHLGCNVENASYPASICAERNAITTMAAEGMRKINKIAIVGGFADGGGDTSQIVTPCGVCRQVIREFCDPETCQVVMAPLNNLENITVMKFSELLPYSFGPDNLEK